jgi:uncharacterized membrane protein YeaQ/YmgE (transglycosylase-associated protein family)
MDDDGQDKDVASAEALEAKAAEARSHALSEADAAEKELHEKLSQLEAKATRSRRSLERAHQRDEAGRPANVEAAQNLGIGLTIAYAIIGAPLAGWLIGMVFDRKPNGPVGAALTVFGAFAGVVYAIVVLNRTNKA